MGKESFKQMMLGQLDIHVQKKVNLTFVSHPIKNVFEVDHLNIRAKQNFWVNTWEKISDLGFGNDFFIRTQKAQPI